MTLISKTMNIQMKKELIKLLVQEVELENKCPPNYGVILEGLTLPRYKPYDSTTQVGAMSNERRFNLDQFIDISPKGAAADIGVYLGHSTKQFLDKNRKTYAFDTFDGFPSVDKDSMYRNGELNSNGIPSIIEGAEIIKGDVMDTLPDFNERLAIAHIDLDMEDAISVALKHIYPLLLPNGMIIVDDYGFLDTPGAKRAVDAFPLGNKFYHSSGQMRIDKLPCYNLTVKHGNVLSTGNQDLIFDVDDDIEQIKELVNGISDLCQQPNGRKGKYLDEEKKIWHQDAKNEKHIQVKKKHIKEVCEFFQKRGVII